MLLIQFIVLALLLEYTLHLNAFYHSQNGCMLQMLKFTKENSYTRTFHKTLQARRSTDDAERAYGLGLDDESEKRKTNQRPSRIRTISNKKATVETVTEDILDKPHFYSRKTFEEIGVNKKMQDILSSMRIVKPSKIQSLSFRTIYSGQSCIIGEQTGSGKTLAYLLPIIQRMEELFANKTLLGANERSPLIVIITPTTELADQVSNVVKTLGNALKFRTSCFTSRSDFDAEDKRLRLGSEVLVTTPGRLVELLRKKQVFFNDLQVIVLDEVDILFTDETFPLEPIGKECPKTTQFLFTSATLPGEVIQQITNEFPDLKTLSGPGLHRVAPTVEEVVIDCSGRPEQERNADAVFENKREALIKVLDQNTAERTIIFCNSIENCRKVENFLLREDRHQRLRDVYPYHSAIDDKARDLNLKLFSKNLLKKPAVLVCTDRASKGMDFNRAIVDHVILFDFPFQPSEYLRRVGRTGRAGRRGKTTVLVYGKQVTAAKTVVKASIAGQKIDPSTRDLEKIEKEEDQRMMEQLKEIAKEKRRLQNKERIKEEKLKAGKTHFRSKR